MIDIAALVKPIPGPSRAGVSLRYEPEYDRIREARRDEDPNLPQGVWQHDLKRADWNEVIGLCSTALAERSKDLQIACWLAEALVHRDGAVGLVEGLEIITGLCDAFWPDLFPAIDDDMTARLAPLEWLDGRLPQAIYTLPLTRSGAIEAVSFSWTDYVNAQRRESVRGEEADAVTAATVLASAEATPTSFYEDLRERLRQAAAAVDRLKAKLTEYCGREAPGFGHLYEAIANLAGFVAAALAGRDGAPTPAAVPPPAPLAETIPEAGAGADDAPLSNDRIQIRSREEAYRLLMQIADYLFTVEPHSPTPYIVQRAASWGMLPLHKLLVELTKGSNDLTTLFELLVIGKGGDPETSGRRT